MNYPARRGMLPLAVLIFAAEVAFTQDTTYLVEDFESYTAGATICGQGPWLANPTYGSCTPVQVVDHDGSRMIEAGTETAASTRRAVPVQSGAVDITWRWKAGSDSAALSVGPANPSSSNPGDWSDFRVRFAMENGAWSCKGASWPDMTGWPSWQADRWYYARLHCDFAANTFSAYIDTASDRATEVALVVSSSMAQSGDCDHIMIKCNSGAGTIAVDDIVIGGYSSPPDTGDSAVDTTESYGDWLYSQRVYLNTATSGADIGAPVENFPLLVRLDTAVLDFSQALGDGRDIRFADPDGAHLPFEIEQWDSLTGAAAVWVLVPRIEAASDTDFVTMYWGNGGAVSRSEPGAVFDTAGSFVGVWHLGEEVGGTGTAGVYRDATYNGHHGDDYISATETDGIVGRGHRFDGNDDFVEDPDAESYLNGLTAFTVSLWVNADAAGTDRGFICGYEPSGGDHTLSLRYDEWGAAGGEEDVIKAAVTATGGTQAVESGANVQSSSWQHVVMTWAGGDSIRLCIDGAPAALSFAESAVSGSVTDVTTLLIGRGPKDAGDGWAGSLDEVRIENVVRTPEWITLSYENQREGSNLLVFGQTVALPTVTLSPLASSVSEESVTAIDIARIELLRSEPAAYREEVYVGIAYGGSAEAGIDYEPLPSWYSVVIPVDSTHGEALIALTPIDDDENEGLEHVTARVVVDSLYEVGSPDSLSVVIADSDAVIPPTVVVHPDSHSAFAGDVVRFSVGATGSGPFTYTWREDGVVADAPNDSVYLTPPVGLDDDSALFDCVVSNAAGSDTSLPALLTVTQRPEPPFVLEQPRSTSVAVGDTATYWLSVSGTRPLSYQWYADSGAITGAHDSALSVGPAVPADDGRGFHCVVSNEGGSVTSLRASLSVHRPTSERIVVTGRLYDHGMDPVGGGGERMMDVVVRLYPGRHADSAVYSETFLGDNGQGIMVMDGDFVVRLGEGESGDNLGEVVRSHPNLFVAFWVGTPEGNLEELEPRTPLTSSPYALAALPETIRGAIDPRAVGLEAPVGTHFVNTASDSTFIRTHNGWAVLHE